MVAGVLDGGRRGGWRRRLAGAVYARPIPTRSSSPAGSRSIDADYLASRLRFLAEDYAVDKATVVAKGRWLRITLACLAVQTGGFAIALWAGG